MQDDDLLLDGSNNGWMGRDDGVGDEQLLVDPCWMRLGLVLGFGYGMA